MKRFIVCMFLLALTLLVARAASAESRSSIDHDSAGGTTGSGDFFDHGLRARSGRDEAGSWRESSRPRRVDERIRFRYRDRGYERVAIEGDFDGWDTHVLHLDERERYWEIELDLGPGRHRYQFVVEDGRGVERYRTDPAVRSRRRDEDRGWASEIRVDRDGDVVTRDRWDRHSDDDLHLDLIAEAGVEYQRADGLFLYGVPRVRSDGPWSPGLEARVGYGFASDEGSVRLTLAQPLTRDGRLRAVISGYDESDFTDRTGVGTFENSLATLAFREDSRDWFRREGLSFGVEADYRRQLLGRLEIRSDQHSSLETEVHAGWWGRERFLPLPVSDQGQMRSLFLRARFGTDLDHLWIEWEHADDDLFSTDFEFTRLEAQYRTRLRLGRQQHLDLRLRYGTTLRGALPRQKRYTMGGIGTVRGYAYQSLLEGTADFGGEQMILANAEYVLDVDEDFGIALFYDMGNAWSDRNDPIDLGDLPSSMGLGLLTESRGDGGLRLDLIKPLDGAGDLMLQGRLQRMF